MHSFPWRGPQVPSESYPGARRPRRHTLAICWLAPVLLLCLTGTAQANDSFSWHLGDPFGTKSMAPATPAEEAAAPKDYRQIPAVSPGPGTFHPDHVYSLAELGMLALANNPDTRSSWAAIRAAAAEVGVSRSADLPTVDLSVSAQRSQTTNSSGYAIPLQKTATPNLSLSWLLFDFGQTAASIDGSKAALRAARFSHDQSIQQVLENVTNSYYQVLADRVLITVARESLKSAETSLKMAEARHRAGQATISDVYQSRAAHAKAKADLDSARLTLRQAQGALASAVGLPIDSAIQLPNLETAVPPSLGKHVQTLMQQALQKNPNLQSAQADVDQSRANLDAADRAGRPTIRLSAQQGVRLQTDISNTRFNSIGLTISVPLFSGYSQTYQRYKARANLDAALAKRDATRQSTELAVWQAYYGFQSAITALPNARAQQTNAEAALKAVTAQYRVGLATIQDLLTAQSNVTSAQVSVAQDVLNAYTALAKLGSSIGSLGQGAFNLPERLDPAQHQTHKPGTSEASTATGDQGSIHD